MAANQDVWTQTDASYDPETERLIRLWLLDAAIQQYQSDCPSSKGKKAWLPDSVFPYPGMSEEEMVDVMRSRDASLHCINYARSRFQEANSDGADKDTEENDQVSGNGKACAELHTGNLSSPLHPVKAFHKLCKLWRAKKLKKLQVLTREMKRA